MANFSSAILLPIGVLLTLPLAAEPLDTKLIGTAMGEIAEAGQIGPSAPGNYAKKLMAKANRTLDKYFKAGKQIEMPANCTFKHAELTEGHGLMPECEEYVDEIHMYVVPGEAEVMKDLEKCREKCIGEFILVNHTRQNIPKAAHLVGPFARYLEIWVKPLSVKTKK